MRLNIKKLIEENSCLEVLIADSKNGMEVKYRFVAIIIVVGSIINFVKAF